VHKYAKKNKGKISSSKPIVGQSESANVLAKSFTIDLAIDQLSRIVVTELM